MFLCVQAMASLQQEKATADVAAGQWKLRFEAAQDTGVSANARVVELEGQLQAKSDEADKLRLSIKQQRQVSSRFHTLKSDTVSPSK